jgi:hypothetical protein
MYKIEGPEDGGKPGKGPNFLLIVTLFGVTMLVIFVVALLVTGDFGKFIHAVHPDHHQTSQLVAAPTGRELA